MSDNLERVYGFLRDVGHTFVRTVEGDQPKSRPLNSICVVDVRLGFMVGDKKDIYHQLVANPKVELVSMNRRTEWLRIEGEAHLAENQSPANKFLERSPFLREKYAEMGMNLRLFLIDDGATVQRRTWEPLEEFPLYG